MKRIHCFESTNMQQNNAGMQEQKDCVKVMQINKTQGKDSRKI